MKLKKNEKRKSESGAIMLEVVAVLSLMGLMGTVLYRQIYQRNQELHNIQMASEIRIVKEAFSAWIHANTAPLYDMCKMSGIGENVVNPCLNDPLEDIPLEDTPLGEILEDIRRYLPDGYFFEEGADADYLADNYDFHLFGYLRGTGSAAIPTYYGVVVPKPGTMLPDGGTNNETWNFRRAARVAMLVGIDGGAYDPNITGTDIVGSVGTWSLAAEGILNSNIPTYVAMTGLDVFQPEVELPRIEVGLPTEHWSMAFQDLNAYGQFTVGQDSNCFTRGDRRAEETDGVFEIQSDDIYAPGTNNCQPAFWVTTGGDSDEETGHVYVLNDLHVGADPSGAESGIQLKKEGAIVFSTTAQDLQNKNQETNYLLDPAFTSVMNDVKLMSRGGAKLSEILPNYILKDVKRGRGHVNVTLSENYCPKGYVVGIRANPISWSDEKINTTNDKGKITDGSTTAETSGHTHDLDDISVTLPDTLAKAKERVVLIVNEGSCSLDGDTEVEELANKGVAISYRGTITKTACVGDKGSTDDSFTEDESAVLEVSVYCIWPDGIDINGDGTDESPTNGSYTFERPSSGRTGSEETYCNSFKAEGTCTLMGCQWNNGNCTKKQTE